MQLPDEEFERQMYWYVKNTLELNGYKHYEISNFAKKGKESKHNTNCWKQKEYIGLGCAAHSYLNKIRYSNTENLDMYIQNAKKLKNDIKNIQSGITENIKIYDIQEIQNEIDTKNEYMMLGLRMLEGVSVQKFKEKFKENPLFLFRKQLDLLVKEKLIEVDLDKIRLTNKGLDFANLVFEEFV